MFVEAKRSERAVIHAKEHGHSAREGKETIQRDLSGQTGLANPSRLFNIETPHLSDGVFRVARYQYPYLIYELGIVRGGTS